MNLDENWPAIKRVFEQSFKSSFHYSIASVNNDGTPQVTPIGSLFLSEPGHGYYFEEFPQQMPQNFKTNNNICVLAVNSSRWFWFKSLLSGKFVSPPAIRLLGEAGARREANANEIQLWRKRVKQTRFTKGYAMMWKNMKMVREIKFTKAIIINLGEMSRNVWVK